MLGGIPLCVTTENADAMRILEETLKVTIQEGSLSDDSAAKLGPGKLLWAG